MGVYGAQEASSCKSKSIIEFGKNKRRSRRRALVVFEIRQEKMEERDEMKRIKKWFGLDEHAIYLYFFSFPFK
jgi:hypothetical protein